MRNEKKSFVLYNSYYTQLELLTMEERGELITAIFLYEKTGTYPDLSRVVNMAFSYIKDALDRDREAYEERCRKNSENGKKGGRPRKNNSDGSFFEKTDRFFTQTKKGDNDNDNENDNDNDNEEEEGINTPLDADACPPYTSSASSDAPRHREKEKNHYVREEERIASLLECGP